MEWDMIVEKAKRYKEIVIFGYSSIGKEVYLDLKLYDQDKKVVFCDNDRKKQERTDVCSVHDAVEYYPDALFIIVSIYHFQEMREQLYAGGVDTSQIVHYIPNAYRIQHSMENMFRRVTPVPELQFEVDLARHCNLNCKYCDHFSPLARVEFPEYEEFARDIERLSFLFKKRAKRIFLLGGEPLLNPEITLFMRCVRICFPDTEISVFTNGLLLEKMGQEFWEECRESVIQIIITKYPIKDGIYQRVEKRCREEQIKWSYFGNTMVCKYSYHYPLDLEGKQDARAMYLHCGNANECITLKNGKLYTCSVAPNIDSFNRYFHQNIELCAEDGIDIYQTDSRQEILNFLSHPIPFCRYCKVYERTDGHKWGVSKRTIDEWT